MFKLTHSTKNEAPPSTKHRAPTRYNNSHDSGYLLRLQRPGLNRNADQHRLLFLGAHHIKSTNTRGIEVTYYPAITKSHVRLGTPHQKQFGRVDLSLRYTKSIKELYCWWRPDPPSAEPRFPVLVPPLAALTLFLLYLVATPTILLTGAGAVVTVLGLIAAPAALIIITTLYVIMRYNYHCAITDSEDF